jgi:hypothetical protein
MCLVRLIMLYFCGNLMETIVDPKSETKGKIFVMLQLRTLMQTLEALETNFLIPSEAIQIW